MRILVACEESQMITKAFRAKGHDAFSCDLQPCTGGHPEWHMQCNVLEILNDGWDMMIGHPPCTYLAYSGTSRWNDPGRVYKRIEALKFFADLWEAPIDKICLENPKGCASPTIAKYTQEVQPYYFGDASMKTTWLWLKNLPTLQHFKRPDLFNDATHTEKPEPVYVSQKGNKLYFAEARAGNNRGGYHRSKTFAGIAQAMADQWG